MYNLVLDIHLAWLGASSDRATEVAAERRLAGVGMVEVQAEVWLWAAEEALEGGLAEVVVTLWAKFRAFRAFQQLRERCVHSRRVRLPLWARLRAPFPSLHFPAWANCLLFCPSLQMQ